MAEHNPIGPTKPRTFSVPPEEQENERAFIREHRKHQRTPLGVAIGCGFTWHFTDSSIGELVSIECTCGKSLDLSGNL